MFRYIMTSVKLLSLVGFIIANYICLKFFQPYILNVPIEFYFLLIIIVFMVLKLDITLWIYEAIKNKIKSAYKSIKSKANYESIKNISKSAHKSIKSKANYKSIKNISKSAYKSIKSNLILLIRDLFNVKNNLILLKMLFFNTAYELFSVYIIWIGILGFVHLTSFYKLELFDSSSFFQMSALIGLLLGIFQFVLQRNEDKILTKIHMTGNRIEQIINQESTFEKFYDSIPNAKPTQILRRWIHNTTDPKLQMRDFFLFLMEDKETKRLFFEHIDKTPISINISYKESSQKFEMLDIVSENNQRRKKDLHKAYNSFFVNEDKTNEIVEKINREINMNDFRLIALSNINIISEVIPQFTSNTFKKKVEGLYLKDNETTTKNIYFESSTEYQQYLHNQVSAKIMGKILS